MFTVDETIMPVLPWGQKQERSEKEPMHPDDFEAHLAWITAKRCHEQVTEKPFPDSVVFYRILG